jgi:alcohol dehydrogenase
MNDFAFTTCSKVILAENSSADLWYLCQKRNVTRVLIVTDKGIVSAGLLDKALLGLKENTISVVVYDKVEPDPSEETVLNAVELARENQIELVIGFGGGSSLDVAKLVAVLSNPEFDTQLSQCYGIDMIKGSRLPLIQVPTTAGTGSEVTSIAIITTGESTKAGVVSDILYADVAVLDPTLTLSLPAHITAATGIDAMVHAIEAYTSKIKKNPISDMLAIKALKLLASNILPSVKNGSDITARSNMLLGATLAGQAFANSPVAAVHALAYPLGGHFHIPHGLSNSLVLPHVMQFNNPVAEPFYAELAPIIMGDDAIQGSQSIQAQALIDWLVKLIDTLGLPSQLQSCGVAEKDLELLAKDAMLQQRLLVNNPREMTQQDALNIYQSAF